MPLRQIFSDGTLAFWQSLTLGALSKGRWGSKVAGNRRRGADMGGGYRLLHRSARSS
jgi:hypothetical protein